MLIPVLMYHEVDNSSDNSEVEKFINRRYIVSSLNFQKQMEYLQGNNYKTKTILELSEIKQGHSEKFVVLTFDDGYAGNYNYAFEIMRKFYQKATIFITTDWVGRPHMLDWHQIRELSDYGIEIGSHTCSHCLLASKDSNTIMQELRISKELIEKNTKKEVLSVSYPNGDYNNEVVRITKQLGYKQACISSMGYYSSCSNDFCIPRMVGENDYRSFEKILAFDKFFLGKQHFKSYLKTSLKLFLGKRIYHNLYYKFFKLEDL